MLKYILIDRIGQCNRLFFFRSQRRSIPFFLKLNKKKYLFIFYKLTLLYAKR